MSCRDICLMKLDLRHRHLPELIKHLRLGQLHGEVHSKVQDVACKPHPADDHSKNVAMIAEQGGFVIGALSFYLLPVCGGLGQEGGMRLGASCGFVGCSRE